MFASLPQKSGVLYLLRRPLINIRRISRNGDLAATRTQRPTCKISHAHDTQDTTQTDTHIHTHTHTKRQARTVDRPFTDTARIAAVAPVDAAEAQRKAYATKAQTCEAHRTHTAHDDTRPGTGDVEPGGGGGDGSGWQRR